MTVDIPAMRVALAKGSYNDCSTAVSLCLKLCGNLQNSPCGVSRTVHAGYHVLSHVLRNLTSGMVLGMDWLHAINLVINWHNY